MFDKEINNISTTSEAEQVSWNLSQALILEISSLLQQASQYYVLGKYWQAFDCLKASKLRFIQSLKPYERKQFEQQEEKVSYWLRYHFPQMADSQPKVWAKIRGHIRNEVDNYNMMVMDTLQKYGYLIQAKENSKEMF